jgi:putative flippase GtrA
MIAPFPAPRARWGPFVLVGVLGFALQLTALAFLARAGWPHALATGLAVELAIVHNFLWHEGWTWRDRTATRDGRILRFVRFNGASAVVSVGGNVTLTLLLAQGAGLPLMAANTVAVGILSLINFALADRWVFSSDLRSWREVCSEAVTDAVLRARS